MTCIWVWFVRIFFRFRNFHVLNKPDWNSSVKNNIQHENDDDDIIDRKHKIVFNGNKACRYFNLSSVVQSSIEYWWLNEWIIKMKMKMNIGNDDDGKVILDYKIWLLYVRPGNCCHFKSRKVISEILYFDLSVHEITFINIIIVINNYF